MDHYLISTNYPGFNKTLLAITRQDKDEKHRFYYDLYQVGHFLGSIFPAISCKGHLVWDTLHQMDEEFVALVGKQILIKGY
jgi:hypothetical protein